MNRKAPILFLILISWLILSPLFYSVKASPAYEDFETFTEVEEIDDIQKNATHVDFLDRRFRTTYLYKDYGVDFFSDFVHWVDFKRVTHDDSAWVGVWMLSNVLGNAKALRVATDEYIVFVVSGSDSHVSLREVDTGGTPHDSSQVDIDEGVMYYMAVNKSGTSLVADVYTTEVLRIAGGNGDKAHLTLTLTVDYSFRYLYVGNTYDDGNSPQGTSDFENLYFMLLFVTFYYNVGGIFRVDNLTITNGTSNEYSNGSVIELASLPQNSSYVFSSFDWNGNNATTNPYNLTITSNMTVWLYFSTPSVDGVYMGYGLMFLSLIIGLVIGVLLGSKK